MYGLFAYKEITALRTKHVYRLEIYKKDFSGTTMELEEFSSSPFSITLEGEGDAIYRPVIKSYLSINIIDKDQFDYTQFFTSDAFGFRVFLLRNGVRLWSGYITPDSFGQDLQYRSTINLVARDNIGYLSEIDYDWFDYDFVSIEQLLTKAFDKIQAQFSLDNRVNIFSGNKPITDAYIQTVGLKDKTWFEVLEEVLSGCGLQLRYINDNYTLHDIANEVELGGNYTPTFIDRSQRVDFSPAWREEQLEQDYLKIDNFFNKMPNKDKYEFIKLNNKDFSRPGERLYTIQGWNQSETNASNGILFNNPDELYYNTSFNQDTGTYIFDKIPNTSMLINSDNKTEYPNSSISTSFICKKSSTPLHINIDAFNELFEVEYYEGIGHVISRHYGFNYNTYHLNFYCNIFLKKEDGSTLICKNNTWEPYDSSNQDYRIELNLPETPDPLTAESFQEDKTQLDIVVKSIPENGDLIFTIYRWGTSYTGTLLGSFAMRIDNIKMYFKDEKEDISGQESKITINESNNVKQSFDFKYGQIPDSSGGYLAFAGGLHDNDDYHTPLTDWYRSAFPENKYNLLELVGRGLAHHGKKARKIMTGTILFDGQDFSKILVIDNEKYVINGGTYDVTKETLTGEFIEVEPYSTDDYVITGGAVSGGSSNISTGGNRDTLLWTDNAANTKRVNELGMATSDDLAGSNLLIDNPEWSEAKRISADMLEGDKIEEGEGIKITFSGNKKTISHAKTSTIVRDYLDKFGHVIQDLFELFHKKGGDENEDFKARNIVVEEHTETKTLSVSENATVKNLLASEHIQSKTLAVSDTASAKDIVIGNSIVSEGYTSGTLGEGAAMRKDPLSGDWIVECDRIYGRKTFTVPELILDKIRAVKGALIVSAGNGKIASVAEESGNYILTLEEESNSFVKGDFVRCQVFTGNSTKAYWVPVTAVEANTITVLKSEFDAGVIPEAGDELVQLGNKSDPDRQTAIYITASDSSAPYIDTLTGINSRSLEGLTRGRNGNLAGISTYWWGQLKGVGLFSENAYLLGDFRLRTGEDVRTKFDVVEGMLQSAMQSVVSSMTEEDNFLKNASFQNDIEHWERDSDMSLFDVNSQLIDLGLNFYSEKNKIADIASYDGRFMLRIKRSYIRQRNAEIAKPDAGSTLYLTIKYHCSVSGQLTVGFNGSALYLEQDITALDGFQSIEISGLWDGTGDFLLQFSGDIYIEQLTLTNHPLEDYQKEVSTKFEQTAEHITAVAKEVDKINNTISTAGWITEADGNKIWAQTTTVNDLGQRVTDNETSIENTATQISALAKSINAIDQTISTAGWITTADGNKIWATISEVDALGDRVTTQESSLNVMTGQISAVVGEVDTINRTISTSGWITTADGNKIWASKELENGEKIVSYINQSPDTVTIHAQHIKLEGLVTANNNFKILADGSIEAKNGIFNGSVSGISGSFKSLNCVNDKGDIVGGISFTSDGRMHFNGDVYHGGYDTEEKRGFRYYAPSIWCRSSFGARERNTMTVSGSSAFYYVNGLVNGSGEVLVYLNTSIYNGTSYVEVPLYAETGDAAGFPVELIIIRSSGNFSLIGRPSQRVTIINANDQNNDVSIFCNGQTKNLEGGAVASFWNIENFMSPAPASGIPGRGWLMESYMDNNW